MTRLGDVLDTEAKIEGWRALLEDNAMFVDAPSEMDFFEWSEGRRFALAALAAATWQLWIRQECGREPTYQEVCDLFGLPKAGGLVLLDEVRLYVRGLTEQGLLLVVQYWAVGKAWPTVGEVAAALQMPVDLIGRVVPAAGPEGGFCYRVDLGLPLQDQKIELEGE